MYTRRANAGGADGMVIDHSLEDQSRVGEIIAILGVFGALSTIAVTLRSYTRLVLLRTLGIDDGVMVAAQVLTIGAAIAIGLEAKYGLGSHTSVQPPEDFIPYMKSFYSSVVVYNIAMCLVKISILLQYRRLFDVRMIQLATFYGVIFLSVWTVMLCFLLTFVCIPVAKFWDSTLPGRCLSSLTIWYIIAGFNLATDFAIFGLPLQVIRSLRLPRSQKMVLFVAFGLGFFTCIISIIRIHTLKIAASTKDPNWENVDAAVWSFLEVTIAILAACLPTLRPILSKAMPRLFGSSIKRSQSRSQYITSVHAPGSSLNTNSNNTNSSNTNARKPVIIGPDTTRSLKEQDSIELATHDSKIVPLPGGYSVSITGVGETGSGFQGSGVEAFREGGRSRGC
ncbi:hypothetical protein ACJ41O_000335 [Fusarium nematophilum]